MSYQRPKIFYDNFREKLLKDFTVGNDRMETALVSLSYFIPKDSKNILDIGCGIGWSSYEFSKFLPDSFVTGLDLSPVLIDTAKNIFYNPNLNFIAADITKTKFIETFSCIIMLDVYEHIRKSDRIYFHKTLQTLMGKQSRIILACPSKFHQEWLRKNQPSGLQPIDEDVDFETIRNLAQEVNGEIIFFEYQKIWNKYDYLYAVIEIQPIYQTKGSIKGKEGLVLEEKSQRKKRVEENLGFKNPNKKNTFFSRFFKTL